MDTCKQAPAEPESLLRIAQVEARVGLSRSGIYQKIQLGAFPAPLRVSHKFSCWRASEIDAWINDKINTCSRAEVR